MLTKAPKGTKDILPDQIYKWQYVEKVFQNICSKYGFSEMRTPTFEHTELFARSVGDTTDIVEKQMYTFDDYAKRSLTLRPEGTSAVARAFLENKLYAEMQPSKYFYEISCFRYEKPQSGRLREFHQFGIEVFGSKNMLADAEVISLGADFLAALGINDVSLHINSIGCPDCRNIYRDALRAFLKPKYDQLCDTCKSRYDRNPMRILDCKSEVCQSLVQGAPVMLDYLCDDCEDAFTDLKKNLDTMGVEYKIDAGIVRGLDYYTKTAFEFVSTSIGAQGTVCGGGRYDNLIEEIGGQQVPGVGFGLGIERLLLVMEASGIEIEKPAGADVFIAFIGEDAKLEALRLCRELRLSGIQAELDSNARNIKGQFKYADRQNAKYVAVIGDDELQAGIVTLKDMTSGNQKEVPLSALAETIQNEKGGK